jgi:ribose transport system substrate-binding protein
MSPAKSLLSFLSLGALALPLLNCGGAQHSPDEKYFVIATNIKIPYWQAAAAGMRQAASQLEVKWEFVGPDTYDPKAEREEFRRVLAQKPSGILISPADPELMTLEINAAIAQGIPVITFDSDAPASKRLLFIGTDNYKAGQMGAQLAAKLMQDKGNVAVYTMPGQANLNERLRGYREVFASKPHIKIFELIDVKGDPRIAFDKTREILEKAKDKVNAFVCLEATACAEVAEVLDRYKVEGKVVVAMDTDQLTLEAIQKGIIAATIAQKPFTMAYMGLKMLDDLHHHKPPSLGGQWEQDPFAPVPMMIDTGATLIDKSNLNLFIQARDAAGKRGS